MRREPSHGELKKRRDGGKDEWSRREYEQRRISVPRRSGGEAEGAIIDRKFRARKGGR